MARKYLPRRKKKKFLKRYTRTTFRIFENMGIRVLKIREQPIQTIQETFAQAIAIVLDIQQLRASVLSRPVPRFRDGGKISGVSSKSPML